MIAVIAGTPNYVLLDDHRRIGPRVVPPLAGIECIAIYGFHDKGPYEKFRANSKLALTPYPLVKGFLQSQIEIRDEGLRLVVVDAVTSDEPLLYAATMEAVLEAQSQRVPQVTATHQLTFDREADAYRVQEASA